MLAIPFSAAAKETGGQSLEQAANDPTASLMSFQLQDFYSPNLWNSGDPANIVQFRSAVPFTAFGYDNIARLTVPFVTESASGKTGVSDTTIFNLTAFNRDWGRFGVGAVGLIPTGERDLGAGKWAIGPAAGFAARNETFLWGLFNQNLFTVAEQFDGPDVNISTLQPLLNYSLGNGWSTGVSEMTFVYDWDEGGFTSLPLEAKVFQAGSARRRTGADPGKLRTQFPRRGLRAGRHARIDGVGASAGGLRQHCRKEHECDDNGHHCPRNSNHGKARFARRTA